MLMMTTDDFSRLNSLSEKAMNETASRNELKEFNELLDEWNDCVEFNLLNGLRDL
jgi:hypothetical protein